jgi:hypothetical protein
MFISSFWAVSERRFTTPISRMKLPNMRQPIRGAAGGNRRKVRPNTTRGKAIFSVTDTGLSCFILISRSFLVVSARMIGG